MPPPRRPRPARSGEARRSPARRPTDPATTRNAAAPGRAGTHLGAAQVAARRRPARAAEQRGRHGRGHGSASRAASRSAPGPCRAAPSSPNSTAAPCHQPVAPRRARRPPGAAAGRPVEPEVQHHVHGRGELAVRRLAAQTGGQGEGLDPGRVRRRPSWREACRSRPRDRCSARPAGPPPHRHAPPPTTSRSGRIRRAWRTSVRTVTSPAPSMFGGRASSQTQCGWWGRSSWESSTRTSRSE